METNKIYQGNVIEVLKKFPDESIDCVITSPPYNVGIDYDVWDDKQDWEDYKIFMDNWLKEVFRVLKKDGRIALNIHYEINIKENGGRIFIASKYWETMEEVGFRFAGIADLKEIQPHRVKLTAWGSWLSPSAPYIYNPKECVIIGYKRNWKKIKKGKSYFTDKTKKEFQELVYGMWDYSAETRGLTKANFSLDIPLKALKILTFEEDIVLDPFAGSGTTGLACKELNRKYILIEISEEYCKVIKERLSQTKLQEGGIPPTDKSVGILPNEL